MDTRYPEILIVKDEAPIRGFIRINLERGGFAVREAADGETALRLVSEIKPHLVLLDLKLPDMDGLEVCRRAFTRDGRPQAEAGSGWPWPGK